MHGNQNNVPPYVKEIVETCKHETEGFREIIIKIIIQHAEDLTWIADEIIDNEGSDYEGDWAEDFVDKYAVDFVMAKLLNLSVTEFEDVNIEKDNLTIEELHNILEAYGPIAIRSKRGNNLPDENLPVSETVVTADGLKKINIYNVDNYPVYITHCILIIGAKDQPTQQVYFVDPNYPQAILSMEFTLFKKNILMTEFVYFKGSNLKQDKVFFSSTKYKNRKIDYDGSIQEMKPFRMSISDEYRVISIWKTEAGSIVPVTSEHDDHLFPELSKFFGPNKP
jgi:hypothetical protein